MDDNKLFQRETLCTFSSRGANKQKKSAPSFSCADTDVVFHLRISGYHYGLKQTVRVFIKWFKWRAQTAPPTHSLERLGGGGVCVCVWGGVLDKSTPVLACCVSGSSRRKPAGCVSRVWSQRNVSTGRRNVPKSTSQKDLIGTPRRRPTRGDLLTPTGHENRPVRSLIDLSIDRKWNYWLKKLGKSTIFDVFFDIKCHLHNFTHWN